MNKIGQWSAQLLLAAAALMFSLGAVFVVGEIAVRRREANRETVPGTMPQVYYPHVRLGHALVRDFDYYGWLHVNQYGFRGPDHALKAPPDVIRVMAVGASTTMDTGVSADDRTWPARLEHWLQSLDAGGTYEVINAGVGGYRVLDNLIRLQTELYRFEPDAIILYHAHNDLFSALRWAADELAQDVQRPGEVATIAPWSRWLQRRSLLYNKLAYRWQAIRFQGRGGSAVATTPARDYAEAIDQGARQFERDLAGFLALARNLGIAVFVPEVLHVPASGDSMAPDAAERWRNGMPFAPTEWVGTGYDRYDVVAREVSSRFGACYVPTAGFGLVDASFYAEGDPVHFNDRGADRMGERLAEALLATGVLNRDSTAAISDSAGCLEVP